MLKYLDVLIGLALVMLIAATVALSISQALLDLFSSRARHLAHALYRLVHQIHPTVLDPHALDIGRLVLLHPMVCMPHGPLSGLHNWVRRMLRRVLPKRLGRSVGFAKRMPARVILREEFVLSLLEWAAGEWPMQFDDEPDGTKAEQRRTALVRALRERGIEDPAATLKAVKLQAMANEREHPEQSAETWRSQALAQCAPSEFLAGLYVSFDNTMNRATTTFGREAQVWVSAVALVLVVIAQLDAFHLVKRLSIDEGYRAKLVAEAQQLTADIDKECQGRTSGCAALDVAQAVVKSRGGGACETTLPEPALTKCKVQASAALLSSPSLDLWPDRAHLLPELAKLPGILLAWILVSLGAPFWYDLLKNLFKLRSLLAQKDDADRGERDTGTKPTATIEVNKGANAGASTPAAAVPAAAVSAAGAAPVGTAPVPAAPPEVDGEMGDLLATGALG